jgi:hypothetical protein
MDINIAFGKDKAGYAYKMKPKPETGSIYLDGKLYKADLPFALLQFHKRKLLQMGYISKRIKIKYK